MLFRSRQTINFDINFFFDTGFRSSRSPGTREYYVDFNRAGYPFLFWCVVVFYAASVALLLGIGIVILKVGIA